MFTSLMSCVLSGIIDYMKKQVGDSSQLLGSSKALREFLGYQEDVSIVGFFNSEEDPLYTTYLEAGMKNGYYCKPLAFSQRGDQQAKIKILFSEATFHIQLTKSATLNRL